MTKEVRAQIDEYIKLCDLVDDFAKHMKAKLAYTTFKKERYGWDACEYTIQVAKCDLQKHLDKGDMLDVANIAMFIWFKSVIRNK